MVDDITELPLRLSLKEPEPMALSAPTAAAIATAQTSQAAASIADAALVTAQATLATAQTSGTTADAQAKTGGQPQRFTRR